MDYDTILARFSHYRGMKKPNKPETEQGLRHWKSPEIDEQDLVAALEGYRTSEWGKAEGYPWLGFIKKPLSWIAKSEHRNGSALTWKEDQSYAVFCGLYESTGADATDADKTKGYPFWEGMSEADRRLAKERVCTCDAAFIKRLDNYLRDKEYSRKPRPKPKSQFERMMDSI